MFVLASRKYRHVGRSIANDTLGYRGLIAQGFALLMTLPDTDMPVR
jgi:hypothetical protein